MKKGTLRRLSESERPSFFAFSSLLFSLALPFLCSLSRRVPFEPRPSQTTVSLILWDRGDDGFKRSHRPAFILFIYSDRAHKQRRREREGGERERDTVDRYPWNDGKNDKARETDREREHSHPSIPQIHHALPPIPRQNTHSPRLRFKYSMSKSGHKTTVSPWPLVFTPDPSLSPTPAHPVELLAFGLRCLTSLEEVVLSMSRKKFSTGCVLSLLDGGG